ncbi:MAG: DUF169 domain-containing protein [Clostridia bacterium]|nr:DUF169 domain-containing protein [Clostridia bacterium]
MAKTLEWMQEGFQTYLNMRSKVVGIQIAKDKKNYDAINFKINGSPMYYCYYVKLASKGKGYKGTLAEMACETSTKVLGLTPYYSDDEGPKGWHDIQIFSSFNLSKEKHAQLKPASSDHYGIAVGPLESYDHSPDILILLLNPYQVMRFMQGYHYHYPEGLNVKMSGQCGVCYESTMYPYEENVVNISALCSGTRFICKWAEDTMMVSLPFNMANQILEGIIKTANPCENDTYKSKILEKASNPDINLKDNYFTKK